MSDEAKPSEPAAAPESAAPPAPPASPPHATFRQSIQAADPVSLGALGTAIAAGVIGVVQTGFMWIARNDEVEAALRAEQLRGCVEYRNVGNHTIAFSQMFAEDGSLDERTNEEFERYINEYQGAISQLYYLLPSDTQSTLDAASAQSADTYVALRAGEFEQAAANSADDGHWVYLHDVILERCDSIIRDVRDR